MCKIHMFMCLMNDLEKGEKIFPSVGDLETNGHNFTMKHKKEAGLYFWLDQRFPYQEAEYIIMFRTRIDQ